MYERVPLTEADREYYAPMVAKASGSTTRQANHLSQEDMEQTLWLWLVEYGHSYIERLRVRYTEQGQELTESDIEATLVRKAKVIFSNELIDYRHFQGNFMYQPKEVRALVLDLLDPESEDIEGRLDLQEALHAMNRANKNHIQSIMDYYFHEKDKSVLARQRASRAISRLTEFMNSKALREQVAIEEL